MPCDPEQNHVLILQTWEIELVISAIEAQRNADFRDLHLTKDDSTKEQLRDSITELEQLTETLTKTLDEASEGK